MERTWIEDVGLGKRKFSGWVHRIKKLKSIVFVILRDRTGYIQLAISPKIYESCKLESVISVEGNIVENPNKHGLYEMQVEKMMILSSVEEELPISVNKEVLDIGLDTLLNHRVLSLRHKKEQAIFNIQSEIVDAFSKFLTNEGFTRIHTPKLVKEGAEGGSNVFELDYFHEKAYLAQSPQFYKQMMVISGLERVYEVGPVFRAESHSTIRHLNEYVSMDLEMGFIEDMRVLMTLETKLLAYIIEHLKMTCESYLHTLNITLPAVPTMIPSIKLSQAVEWINEKYGKTLEGDLDPEGEALLHEYIYETTGSEFVFITHYPKYKRPMYTMPEGKSTQSFDLLFRGLEITTGGLRIHDLKLLIESMKEKGLNPEDYESYLEAFKYGVPPHGGLAIGLERLTARLLNINNVRRTTLFPRDKTRLTP